MRHDFIIGLIVSILLHGGVAALGLFQSPFKPPPPKDPEKLVLMDMPPLESDEPEKTQPEDQPEEVAEIAPPVLPDVPQIAPPDAFIQLIQPPPPDGLKPNVSPVTIPQGSIGPRTRNEIFDPRSLDQQPSVRFQSKPAYPFEMRHGGFSGSVTVGFVVDANGDTHSVYAIKSTQREFESAAILAVSKWKFRPGRRGGTPVSTRMSVPIVFNIANE